MATYEADSVIEGTSDTEIAEVGTDQTEIEDETSESVADDSGQEPEEAEGGEESEQDDDQPGAESDLEAVEIEYEGESFKVPPKLKDAFMREQDYTTKTQDLSQQRQAHQAEVSDFSQFVEASTAHQQAVSQMAAIDMRLSEFANIDWNAAFDADITSATKARHQMEQLQAQRSELSGNIEQAETERQRLRHENMVRTAQRTDAQLAKEIPGWGDERKTELGRFAVETLGFPADAVSKAVTAPEIMTLHLAEIGFKAQQRVKAGQSKAGKKQAVLNPSKSIAPKRQSAPKTLSSVTDPAKYRELRMAQKRKQASKG